MSAGTSPPTWLLVLQAISYCVGAVAFCVTLWALALGGFRIRARAYIDRRGTVVVEIANVGRLGGYVAECYLVRRHKWRRARRRYEQISTPQDLRPDSPALLIPAAGQRRMKFPVQVDDSWRNDARVLITYRRFRRRVIRPRSVQGLIM